MLQDWFIMVACFVGGVVILTAVIVSLYYIFSVFILRRDTRSQEINRRPWVDLELEKYNIVKIQNSLSIIDVSSVSEQQSQQIHENTSETIPLSPTGELVEIPLTPLYPTVNTTENTQTATTTTTPKLRKFLLIKKQTNVNTQAAEDENPNEKCKDGASIQPLNETRPLNLQEKAKSIQKQYSKIIQQAWGKIKLSNNNRYPYSTNSSLLPVTQA